MNENSRWLKEEFKMNIWTDIKEFVKQEISYMLLFPIGILQCVFLLTIYIFASVFCSVLYPLEWIANEILFISWQNSDSEEEFHWIGFSDSFNLTVKDLFRWW